MTIYSPTTVEIGHSRDFEIDGRAITLTRTADAYVISESGRAEIIRPLPGGQFVVTGAVGDHELSEPAGFDDTVALALERLKRRADRDQG